MLTFIRLKKVGLSVCLLCCILLAVACTHKLSSSEYNAEQMESMNIKQAQQTFGIIFPMTDPAYEQVIASAEGIAKENQVRLIIAAPEEANLEQQIRILESLVRQKVDGIAISPVDGEAIIPAINSAIEHGIPVVCFESDAPSSNRLTYIGSDNVETGKRLGEAVDHLLNGKGMIIVGTGMSDMLSLRERLEGLLDYLYKETEIEVLEVNYNEGNKDDAIAYLEQSIDDHPHFSAFISLDSISSSASILIWKAAGLKRYVLTIGETEESEAALANGQIHTIISQNEQQWGETIITSLLQANELEPMSSFINMGIKEITKVE